MSAPADESNEIKLSPETPPKVPPPPITCPPPQITLEDSACVPPHSKTPRTPRLSLTPFITPLGSPVRKALRFTKLDPHDAWLPITESRNGNEYYAAFHTLCSGIGIQALVLPVAFTFLGW